MSEQNVQMRSLSVTVVAGFIGAGKSSLIRHAIDTARDRRIAVIHNDLTPEHVKKPLGASVRSDASGELSVGLVNECVGCTFRERLVALLDELASSDAYDRVLLECSSLSDPMLIADVFSIEETDGTPVVKSARLDRIVTVIDAGRFPLELAADDELKDRGMGIGRDDARAVAELVVNQAEFAHVLVVNKIDAVAETEVNRLEAFLGLVNPDALVMRAIFGRVSLDVIFGEEGRPSDPCECRPGWR